MHSCVCPYRLRRSCLTTTHLRRRRLRRVSRPSTWRRNTATWRWPDSSSQGRHPSTPRARTGSRPCTWRRTTTTKKLPCSSLIRYKWNQVEVALLIIQVWKWFAYGVSWGMRAFMSMTCPLCLHGVIDSFINLDQDLIKVVKKFGQVEVTVQGSKSGFIFFWFYFVSLKI